MTTNNRPSHVVSIVEGEGDNTTWTEIGAMWTHKDGKGGEYRFRGVFHVVRENDFAIQTFEYEGFPDVVAIESLQVDGTITRPLI